MDNNNFYKSFYKSYGRLDGAIERIRIWNHFIRLQIATKIKEPVLLYVLPKVGSSTMWNSLNKSGSNKLFFQLHNLSPESIINARNSIAMSNTRFVPTLILNSIFFSKINHFRSPHKLKIITLTRDPVSRNLSAFFQNIDKWVPDIYQRGQLNKRDFEELFEIFFSEYPHNYPLEWFDNELKSVYEFDVFSHQFEKEKGYQIYQENLIEVLLLKMESINECAQEAIHEFIGIDNFQFRGGKRKLIG